MEAIEKIVKREWDGNLNSLLEKIEKVDGYKKLSPSGKFSKLFSINGILYGFDLRDKKEVVFTSEIDRNGEGYNLFLEA